MLNAISSEKSYLNSVFPVNIHCRQESTVFSSYWIQIGPFKYQAHRLYVGNIQYRCFISQVIIEGVRGSQYQGDIALDEISFTAGCKRLGRTRLLFGRIFRFNHTHFIR